MEKKILTILIVLLAYMTPKMSYAGDIILKVKLPTGGARTEIPVVSANEDGETLTVNVDKYIGKTFIYIYDETGNIIISDAKYITKSDNDSISLTNIGHGYYSLVIVTYNYSYYGKFYH